MASKHIPINSDDASNAGSLLVHDKQLGSALTEACAAGNAVTVQQLLRHIEEGTSSMQPLLQECFLVACRAGHVDVVQHFLGLQGEHHIVVGSPLPAHQLAASCHPRATQQPIYVAAEAGRLGVVQQLLALDDDRAVQLAPGLKGALPAACQGGHLPVVQALLAAGSTRLIDVNAYAGAAFRQACCWGHLAIVRLLLSLEGGHRVDIHAGAPETGFIEACTHGRDSVVQELLSLVGDRLIDTRGQDCASLRAAARAGHTAVVERLLALTGTREVDIHVKDDAVYAAVFRSGYTDLLETLMLRPMADQPRAKTVLDFPMMWRSSLALLASKHCLLHGRAVLYAHNSLRRGGWQARRFAGDSWMALAARAFGLSGETHSSCERRRDASTTGYICRLALHILAKALSRNDGRGNVTSPAEGRFLGQLVPAPTVDVQCVLLAILRSEAMPAAQRPLQLAALQRAELPPTLHQHPSHQALGADLWGEYTWRGMSPAMWGCTAPQASINASAGGEQGTVSVPPALCRIGRRAMLLHRHRARGPP